MAIQHAALPAEVARFAAQQGLTAHLYTALHLIATHFPEAGEVTAALRQDPENPRDQWIALRVTVPAALPERRARDERLLDAWLATVPWPAVERIVTVYDLA